MLTSLAAVLPSASGSAIPALWAGAPVSHLVSVAVIAT